MQTEQSYRLKNLAPLLQVFDMPTSLAFYRDVLGFKVVSTDAEAKGDHCGWAMLRRDGATLMLNTAYEADRRPAAPGPHRVRAHDDTGLYFSCPDIDAVYEHLRTHGCNVKPPATARYGMRQLYVKDPDGYAICFQWSAAPART